MGDVKKIIVPGKTPVATSFKTDEIVINSADGKAFIKKANNTVIELAAGSRINTSSFFTSASVNGNTITFTQGDNTTSNVSVIGGAGGSISASDEGVTLSNNVTSFNFVGNAVTATGTTAVTVTVNTGSTVSSYNDLTNVPANIVSGSSQIASNISGAINAATGTLLNLQVPTDGNYSDGLLPFTSSETNSTSISDAIDDINEVLAGLAPSAAPNLDDISGSFSGVSGKLSFGADNTITAHGGYTNVSSTNLGTSLGGPDSTFTNAQTNQPYNPGTSNNHLKLGIIDAISDANNDNTLYTTITGILNDDVAQDSGTFINHGANAFGDGDKGVLALYVNNNTTPIHTQSLSGSGDAIASSLNADGSGFLNISATQSAHFVSSGNELTVFKHRSGSFIIQSSSQITGWNYARVEHQLLGSTLETNYIEWVNEVDSASLGASSQNISFTGDGTKFLSGVKYFTSFTAEYKVTVTNAYKNVYSSDLAAIDYNNNNSSLVEFDQHISTGSKILHLSNNTVTTDSDAPTRGLPTLNTGKASAKDTDLQLTASLKSKTDIACTTTGTAFQIKLDAIKHPTKANMGNAGVESITQLLLDNRTDDSTLQKETFVSESVGRIPSASYNTQTSATNAKGTFNSQASIASTTDLMVASSDGNNNANNGNGVLVYPDNINGGNYSTLTNGPGSNVNYSSVSGNKNYYRIFKNESGQSLGTVDIKIKGNATLVTRGNEDNSSNDISCRIKYPGGGAGTGTGYLDLGAGQADGANLSVDNTPSNASGTPDTTIDSTGASNTLNLFAAGAYAGNTMADNEHIVVNLQTGQGFTGKITEIEITNFT
jgi:hypothetical protein